MARTEDMTGRWIRLLCVIALVMLAFAHRPSVALTAQLTPLALENLRLPDGTLPDICSSDEDGKTKPHQHASAQCDACRLSASVLLPEPADQAALALVFPETLVFAKPAEAHYRQLFPPNTAPRGPPASA